MYAIEGTTGNILWSYPTEDAVLGSAAIADIDNDGNLDFKPIKRKIFTETINEKCINCTVFAFCGGPCFADLFNEENYPFHCLYKRKSIIHYAQSLA